MATTYPGSLAPRVVSLQAVASEVGRWRASPTVPSPEAGGQVAVVPAGSKPRSQLGVPLVLVLLLVSRQRTPPVWACGVHARGDSHLIPPGLSAPVVAGPTAVGPTAVVVAVEPLVSHPEV